MAVTIDIYFDMRGKLRKKTNDFPFKLKVYYAGETRFFPTVYGLSPEDEKKLTAHRLGTDLKALKDNLADLEESARKIAKEMEPFSFADFVRNFLHDNRHIDQTRLKAAPILPNDVDFDYSPYLKRFKILGEMCEDGTLGQVFQHMIKAKIRQGDIGIAVSYQSTYRSFFKYGGNVHFKRITKAYLQGYSEWMKREGNKRNTKSTSPTGTSKTTIGIYSRNLRTAFNLAIDDLKIVKRAVYPFGKKQFKIPGTRNVKKAYSAEEIQKVYHYQCPENKPWLKKAKDFVFFILFGNGLNPADVCELKRRDLRDDMIIFERHKTDETQGENQVKVVIVLDEDLKGIIDRQCTKDKDGNPDLDPESYLFPILSRRLNPLELFEERQLFIEFVNKWLTYIFHQVGVDKVGRCQDLRHTNATFHRLGGADLLEIGERLGHKNPATTKLYVDSLPIEHLRRGSSRLAVLKQMPEAGQG